MKKTFVRYFKWSLLSAASGLLAGLASALFLILLDRATNYRLAHEGLIWFLPLAGFAVGWVYHHYGKEAGRGHNLILDEIHDPRQVTPLSMAPFVLFGTVTTHLFGGSAGREGAAVQMGASLSDQLSKLFKLAHDERKILLVCGAGAGFGAALGAPWAGIIFGMEVIEVGRLRIFALFECFIASFVAYGVTRLLHAPHSVFPVSEVPHWHWKILFGVSLAAVAFGLMARFFARATHLIEKGLAKFVPYAPFRPLLGGAIVVVLYAFNGSYRYAGLGIDVIQDAFHHVSSFADPAWKAVLTALTVGSGFKGGEFVPLVFMGTTLGSALAGFLPVSSALLASVGFVAVFAGASKTPVACTIMAVELFGISIAPYALVACFISYFISGQRGIYRSQKIR